MTVYYPDSISAKGQDTWLFLVALATRTAMTVAESTATTGCVLQNAFRPGFGLNAAPEKIEDPRQGALYVYEQAGVTKITIPDMIVIDRPQDTAGAATRKHLDVLAVGAAGFLIERRGLGSAKENWAAFAIGHKYEGVPVQVAANVPTGGDSGQFERTISFAVTGALFQGAVVA